MTNPEVVQPVVANRTIVTRYRASISIISFQAGRIYLAEQGPTISRRYVAKERNGKTLLYYFSAMRDWLHHQSSGRAISREWSLLVKQLVVRSYNQSLRSNV
jgi:citrate lyase synthetase